jgi:cytochrome b561
MSNRPASSPPPAPAAVYDRPSIVFHWASALFILLLWGIAQIWGELPRGTALRHTLQETHVSLGIVFLFLFMGRILWRTRGGRSLPPPGPPLLARLARAGHAALYGLMAALAVSGPLNFLLRGEEGSFFGLFPLPALLSPHRTLAHGVNEVHGFLATLLLILAALHALAALFHQFFLRDGTLARMIPALARKGGQKG